MRDAFFTTVQEKPDGFGNTSGQVSTIQVYVYGLTSYICPLAGCR